MERRARGYRFEGFELDLATRELTRNGRCARMAEKPFQALTALLEQPGRLVTRAVLCERLWPDGTNVDFANNLNTAIATLREHLGESARAPRLVETLPRLGYRFTGTVQPQVHRPRRRIAGYAVAVLVVAAVATLSMATGRWWDSGPTPGPTAATPGAATPADPAARVAYLRGVALLDREGPTGLQAALESLTEATLREPDFAPAHGARGEALFRTALQSPEGEVRAGLDAAHRAAEAALARNPDLATAHRVVAAVALHRDWDLRRAEAHLGRALAGDPADGDTWLAAASLSAVTGRHDRAVEQARRAVELDPASYLVRSDLGYFLLAAGRPAEAREACRLALELDPDFVPALRFLLESELRLGLPAEAARTANRILQVSGATAAEMAALSGSPEEALAAYRRWNLRRSEGRSALGRALAHAALGERTPALEWLERSFEAREPFLIYLDGYAQLEPLHGDPRFEAIRDRLGLPASRGTS